MAERFVTYNTEDAEAGKVPVNGDGVLDPAGFGGFRGIMIVYNDTTGDARINITFDELHALFENPDANYSVSCRVFTGSDSDGYLIPCICRYDVGNFWYRFNGSTREWYSIPQFVLTADRFYANLD